jgi:hypothetical protein
MRVTDCCYAAVSQMSWERKILNNGLLLDPSRYRDGARQMQSMAHVAVPEVGLPTTHERKRAWGRRLWAIRLAKLKRECSKNV